MKVANAKDWQTDAGKVANGARLDIGKGRALIVRRAGTRNREFMAAVAGIDSADERAQMETYARSVVCGWEGMGDEHGVAVPFTPEDCLDLFIACPEIFDAVWLFASNRSNYRAEELAQERDEVKPPSGG